VAFVIDTLVQFFYIEPILVHILVMEQAWIPQR